jgi:D-glucosaminate-6-phosphate ammonia-lyase
MSANAPVVDSIGVNLDSIKAYVDKNALVNADARLSTLGGARLAKDVVDAMSAVNQAFLDFGQLERTVCERLASITRNDAAAVTNGACAGLILATLACVTARAPGGVLTKAAMRRARVAVPADGISPYLDAVDPLIGELEIGNSLEDCERMLDGDAGTEFVAIIDTVGRGRSPEREQNGTQRLSALARRHQLGLIIDAAAQLPPIQNLWKYTVGWGASCAVFSGGKELGGPQTSGLVLGDKWICEGIRRVAFPLEGVARGFKIGRAELVGLLVAVSTYMDLDHQARRDALERLISRWVTDLSEIPGIRVWREFPNEAGQPLPRLGIGLHPARQKAVAQALETKNVRIGTTADQPGTIFVTPEMLTATEAADVISQLREVLVDSLK